MQDIHSILKRYWGYEAFRPQQEAIIQAVLAGKDALALLPTGGGKSICYQVPALAQQGICLVVSPLIALMKDQVENLKKRGIGALVIYSGMPRKDIVRTLENARQDYFKFLYVSPERLETALFKEYLPALQINLIAVDEAHCVSQWGYDFRPSYLRIAKLREELPDVPVLAVTASATAAVQKDICEKLAAPVPKSWSIFRQSFERKNLSYSVFKADGKSTRLVAILKKVPGSAIVYCKSRKRTTEVAALLQLHGLPASYYHAGLPQDERSKRQQAWVENKVRIVVCTNAFGMGIDKPDVRTVVHMDAPDCLENYYQEAGRCGRDGARAYAVLLYDEKDLEELDGLHGTRYPSFDAIRQVYEGLMNFLQVPVHSGQDQSFPFRLDNFVRNFGFNVHQALYSLQALESDGWLEYNEKNFTPSTLQFTVSKTALYEFYKSHPQYEHLLTTLLRTYEGIFDFPVFVSEALLLKLVKEEEKKIKTDLQTITAYGIIRYLPQNDEAYIGLRKNRVAKADLQMNLVQYNQRREIFVQRVKAMLAYVGVNGCRSQTIGRYFGDEAATECGICDSCLAKKKELLSPIEFDAIAKAINALLLHKQCAATDVIDGLAGIKKEKTWKVLAFLQAEKKVAVTKEGLLYLP